MTKSLSKVSVSLTLTLTAFAGFFIGCSQVRPQVPTAGSTLTNGKATPTAAEIRSRFNPGELTKLCDAAMARSDSRLDAIAKLKVNARTPESTILTFETITADLTDEAIPLTFMGYVSTNEGINAEGAACESRLNQYMNGVYSRRDLYQALKSQEKVIKNSGQARLLSETLKNFDRAGMKLSDADLAKLKDLKNQLSAKEAEFTKNLNTDQSTVTFTPAELKGAPADFLARLKKTPEGNYVVTTKSTDFTTVMEDVESASARRRMDSAYLNRGGMPNVELLQEAISLREQIAKLMGFDTWADYRIEPNMAKSSEVVPFLNDLKVRLDKRNQADMAQLLAFKREKNSQATSVDEWDIRYLQTQLKKRDYALDDEKIREYFPKDTVISGMFHVYSEMLGVDYVKVNDADVWADGVDLYEIRNKADHRLIGYFYTDFIPRPLKYGHAAAFPLITGRTLANGQYSLPVSAIVANFTPPGNGKPSLLKHEEVEVIFHEFGHIMHQTLTRAPYASLSGSSVAHDFVEAPSQMLENWVWNPQILSLLSGHYLDHSKLPDALLKKMIEVKNFQQGFKYTKQLLYALFDMTIHTQHGPVDVTRTYNDLYRDILHQEPIRGSHFAASFGHLMGGYDAGYYGYLWSKVYAEDMFTAFPTDNLMSSEVGGRYRKVILESGNMRPALTLLREFLGREPNNAAFFRMLGIQP